MKHANWSCIKCNEEEYNVGEIRVDSSFWTKIFNIQYVRCSSVFCNQCSYTEFYKSQPASGAANAFDFFTN